MDIKYNYKLMRKILQQNAVQLNKLEDILQEISSRVFNRLDFIKITPNKILDCGYGSGYDNHLLKAKFNNSEYYNLDLIKDLLPKNQSGWLKKILNKSTDLSIIANALAMPFTSNIFDLVYANLVIPYIDDIEQYINEIFRTIAVGGTCVLSGFGVDSFKELRELGLSTFRFPDMHDIGDMLIAAGFNNPVVDTEYLKIQYDSLAQALQEMQIVGCGAANSTELQSILTKQQYHNIQNKLHDPINITIELFVVHGWKDSLKVQLPDGLSPIKFVSKNA